MAFIALVAIAAVPHREKISTADAARPQSPNIMGYEWWS
jgi:hypothetical protein